MYKQENNFKTSPEKNLIFKLQSELSFEKSKSFRLSQELFELKLELASTKNNFRNLEAELTIYKSNEKKLHSYIQKLECQLSIPNDKIAMSQLLIKRPIFSDLQSKKKFSSQLDSPQTKIFFTPMIGKKYDPNDEIVDQESSDDSLDDIAKQEMENLFKKGNKAVIGDKIFEDFLIIGADNKGIFEMLENHKNSIEHEILNPKILYSFKKSLKPDHLATILHCAFPFGIECKKLKITDSFSSLNEILYASNTLFEQRDRSFVFVLKCDEDIEKEINCQYKISLNSSKNLRKVSLLQTSNPNHLKYCICFVSNDYQQVTIKKSCSPSKEDKKKKKKDKETTTDEEYETVFFSTKKVYCFVSYYPFIKFFTDVIISILNYLKVNKMKFSHEHEVEPIFEVYKKLDSSFLHHQMNNELELILKNIYENQIPCFASTLIFPNFDDLKGMIEFQIPQESHCFFLEAEWLSSCVFSNFKCEKFLFLFLALMLEKTLVFFSRNLALLTSTLMTFVCLLKPFKWPHPMIFNIPESLLEFLDSPVPILIGINKGKEYILEKKLNESHKECIFINIDEVEIFNDFHLDEEVHSQFYHQLAIKLNVQFDYFKHKKETSGKKNVVMNPDKNDKEACLKIFEIIKEFLDKEIIEYIEKNKSKFVKDKGLGTQDLSKLNEIQDGFIRRFVQTQMFSYFISGKF